MPYIMYNLWAYLFTIQCTIYFSFLLLFDGRKKNYFSFLLLFNLLLFDSRKREEVRFKY